ncbi:alpha/beta fold hydrolase [Paractinoplanes durhamensis]|uniref:alpha/beta fold hydrolase n=1 Tax=Paractinoplanes durhamensis TaxID=113563 RepID=UPI00363DFEE6
MSLDQANRGAREAKVGDRILAYEIAGPDDGMPVFLLHGTPGSSSGPRPRNIVLHRLGVRLISYDRPGYGESTRQPGRKVVDAAADVRTLANELGIDRYGVVGRSGGGRTRSRWRPATPTTSSPPPSWSAWPRPTPPTSTGSAE